VVEVEVPPAEVAELSIAQLGGVDRLPCGQAKGPRRGGFSPISTTGWALQTLACCRWGK